MESKNRKKLLKKIVYLDIFMWIYAVQSTGWCLISSPVSDAVLRFWTVVWTGPRFRSRFEEMAELDLRSSSVFTISRTGPNLSEPGLDWTFLDHSFTQRLNILWDVDTLLLIFHGFSVYFLLPLTKPQHGTLTPQKGKLQAGGWGW